MVDHRVSVEDLRTFLAVATTEHVTAAAQQLHLTQPAVTRAIARVEQRFGVRLFDRVGNRIRLNRFGETLVAHAERIVAQLEAAQTALADLFDPQAGRVRFGFLPTLGTWLVPELLRRFREVEPRIEFDLRQGPSEQIAAMLRQGEVDAILTSPRPHLAEPLAWRPVGEDGVELVVPPTHRLAGRARADLAEVADDPFVALAPQSEFRQISDRLCEQAGFRPAIAFESAEVATVRGLVAAGLGVAIIPAAQPPAGPGAAVRLPIDLPGASRPIGLAWMAERAAPGATERFRDWLVAEAGSEIRDIWPRGPIS